VWQCGGSMEVLPCARVAHIERTKKPYNNDIDYYAKRNALRAAENPGVDFGDVSERVALRKRLQCRSFRCLVFRHMAAAAAEVSPICLRASAKLGHADRSGRVETSRHQHMMDMSHPGNEDVRNSKASGYCLDQGSEDDDKAILYPCHGMSSQ
ncbi:hypothetical protein KUCAC02_024777, partial [Chaenocephalus aceratus]